MAVSRLSLTFSLLFLSLLVIKSAYGDASSKYGFDGTPAYSPQAKPEGDEKHYYGTKPDNYEAKPEEKPEYGRKPYVVKPGPEGEEKPYYGTKPEGNENRLSIGVQGLILCKSGSTYYPIQGALAKITCKAVDEVGVEKTLSTCSGATDAKGYFFTTVSHLDKLKLRECKAYLQSSPLETCNVPTNVNKAIDGAPLSSFRVLNEKRMKLYPVGPFFYTSEAKPAS
ncbi:proline-rich protein 1-like [Durio zibethinus]|uniref:Proline-rich protein 1-like n=1 Tax=Durio zibethinus TaxID=66656 RepID=A0A6P6B1M8_DURZI|nr:proline-rich protein 1-like [Durio zibethinus]